MTKSEINLINTKDVNIEDATPAMQKFLELKREYPDSVLMYRMGDFYETFDIVFSLYIDVYKPYACGVCSRFGKECRI